MEERFGRMTAASIARDAFVAAFAFAARSARAARSRLREISLWIAAFSSSSARCSSAIPRSDARKSRSSSLRARWASRRRAD